MIKVESKVNGKIIRRGEVKVSQDGKQYIRFGVGVYLVNRNGESTMKEISVSADTNKAPLANLIEGVRVEVDGVAMFRKRNGTIYVNFSANSINLQPSGTLDSFTGTLHMTGKAGKDIEERPDRRGQPILLFSAYNGEKVKEAEYAPNGDVIKEAEYEYVWVNLTQFKAKRPEWLKEKAQVELAGTFEASVYKGDISLGCLVKELKPYVRPDDQQQA